MYSKCKINRFSVASRYTEQFQNISLCSENLLSLLNRINYCENVAEVLHFKRSSKRNRTGPLISFNSHNNQCFPGYVTFSVVKLLLLLAESISTHHIIIYQVKNYFSHGAPCGQANSGHSLTHWLCACSSVHWTAGYATVLWRCTDQWTSNFALHPAEPAIVKTKVKLKVLQLSPNLHLLWCLEKVSQHFLVKTLL